MAKISSVISKISKCLLEKKTTVKIQSFFHDRGQINQLPNNRE